MTPDGTLFDLTLACMALFLIGVNAAMLYRFWPEPWLSIKVCGVSFLLGYVALSATFGHPAQWRVGIGAAAVTVDLVASIVVWRALQGAKVGEGVLVAYRRR